MNNKEVSKLFNFFAKIMEVHGENPYKTKSLSNAAFQIGRLQDDVFSIPEEDWINLPGIGKTTAQYLHEIKTTGTIQALEKLMEITPEGVQELLLLKGLGGKKIGIIWKDLGVTSLGELKYACLENRLSMLKGFGEKTQQNVLKQIDFIIHQKGKFHYASAIPEADFLKEKIETLPMVRLCKLTGDMRRQCPVVDAIEFVVDCTDPDKACQELADAGVISDCLVRDQVIEGNTISDIKARLFVTDDEHFEEKLMETTLTSSLLFKQHQQGKLPHYDEAVHIPYIFWDTPAILENPHDYHADGLLHEKDIRGLVHCHSTYSDGQNSIREMAEACMERNLEYMVISDHSQSAFYAGGLKADEIHKQHAEIDQINQQLAPFRIFKSIESDILNDGSLDYPDELLASFDLVIASVHSQLNMDREKATQRVIRAVENPFTTILGHPTGRLLLSREGYPLDMEKVIDACAAHQVVIEVNANPWRLDLDFTWIPYAVKKGIKLSINPDAHQVDGIDDIRFGVLAAQKGGLKKGDTVNTLGRDDFEEIVCHKSKASEAG